MLEHVTIIHRPCSNNNFLCRSPFFLLARIVSISFLHGGNTSESFFGFWLFSSNYQSESPSALVDLCIVMLNTVERFFISNVNNIKLRTDLICDLMFFQILTRAYKKSFTESLSHLLAGTTCCQFTKFFTY